MANEHDLYNQRSSLFLYHKKRFAGMLGGLKYLQVLRRPKIQDSILSSEDGYFLPRILACSMHCAILLASHNRIIHSLHPKPEATGTTMSIFVALIVAAFAAVSAQPPVQIGDRPFSLISYVVSLRNGHGNNGMFVHRIRTMCVRY